MKRNGLTKTFMMISNSMVYAKIIQRFKIRINRMAGCHKRCQHIYENIFYDMQTVFV